MNDVFSRLRKRSTRRLSALVLVGAVALSGCAAGDLDRAATVNGQRISISDVQGVVQQYSQVNPVSIDQVLTVLIVLPVLDEVAVDNPGQITEQQLLRWSRDQGIAEPTDAFIDYMRGLTYLQTPQITQAVDLQSLADLDVDVSPRYGTWDAELFMVTLDHPEWIIPADGPAEPASDEVGS